MPGLHTPDLRALRPCGFKAVYSLSPKDPENEFSRNVIPSFHPALFWLTSHWSERSTCVTAAAQSCSSRAAFRSSLSSGVSQIQKKIGLIALAEKRHQNGLIARRTLKGNAVRYYAEKPSVATPQKCPITLGAIPTTNGIYGPWPKQQRATACWHEKGQVATIPSVSGHPWRHTSDSRILLPNAKTTDSSSLLTLDTEKHREALGFLLEYADRYLPTGALNCFASAGKAGMK